ncbi:hypothetical protein PINS_up019891 [Pythium insidiosum]|nr:hypothetical protein PINS_up019891 [Pythium insidiosum]
MCQYVCAGSDAIFRRSHHLPVLSPRQRRPVVRSTAVCLWRKQREATKEGYRTITTTQTTPAERRTRRHGLIRCPPTTRRAQPSSRCDRCGCGRVMEARAPTSTSSKGMGRSMGSLGLSYLGGILRIARRVAGGRRLGCRNVVIEVSLSMMIDGVTSEGPLSLAPSYLRRLGRRGGANKRPERWWLRLRKARGTRFHVSTFQRFNVPTSGDPRTEPREPSPEPRAPSPEPREPRTEPRDSKPEAVYGVRRTSFLLATCNLQKCNLLLATGYSLPSASACCVCCCLFFFFGLFFRLSVGAHLYDVTTWGRRCTVYIPSDAPS